MGDGVVLMTSTFDDTLFQHFGSGEYKAEKAAHPI